MRCPLPPLGDRRLSTRCGHLRRLRLKPTQADGYDRVDKKSSEQAKEHQRTSEKSRLTFASSNEAAPERHAESSARFQTDRHDREADARHGEKHPTRLIDLHLPPAPIG